ncbi:uncharacterized protein K452DRAFT_282090 [Aplosporella prunicola CBS 121167]|uniref:Uncharacterized protein n=1 Tax=Aplosporella prunicola CBS 121167 TaxID=1176127 RepID=A0A6A6BW77_9PEZI|nr:uncharacterized protein K452DRAFT_282090 [Aplosporella prunicola CBS 121167]KAF2147104.1 hypothetical protein K452DRAFT_282090 [Aplosporella prunicola CBS 121167]
MPTSHHYAALVSPSPSPPPHFHPRPRSINSSLHRVPSSLSSYSRSSSRCSSSSSDSTPRASASASATLSPYPRPRPLPDLPARPASTSSSLYSDAPEPILCIIREIDDHLSGFAPQQQQHNNHSAPLSARPTLRKKHSPRRESLRELRNRDSEASLQLAYERQLASYLDGSWFRSTRRRGVDGELEGVLPP